MTGATARLVTSRNPGAVAIVEVEGELGPVLTALDLPSIPIGRLRLSTLPGLGDILLARVSEELLQFMPTGGPQVVRRLTELLRRAGCDEGGSALSRMQAAGDSIEAAMAAALPAARTNQAMRLLLRQPTRWREFRDVWTDADELRSARLRHLLDPPTMVLFGPPNVGKSTLLNHLAGRCRAVTDDAPGTTRDWIGVDLNLAGLPVHFIDTPGFRQTADPVEAAAQASAQQVVDGATIRIAAGDASSGWPPGAAEADLCVGLRADLGTLAGGDVSCSAATGDGIDDLVLALRSTAVRDDDLASERPWRWQTDLPIPGRS